MSQLARMSMSERSRRRGQHSHGSRSGGGGGWVVKGLAIVVVLCAIAYVGVQLLRPVPTATAHTVRSAFTAAGAQPSLPWPAQGEAALAVQGTGMVGSSGGTKPVPIASITKVMTALVVLSDHPLKLGQGGPQITVTAADVAQYQADAAGHQSVAPVTAGEKLTELQALQALLIPSANNVAHLLATWDRGSLGAFVAAMNAKASALGLSHSHFVGPSGLNPGSVSTAEDVVQLGEVAMANPVFASVVAMPSVTLPGTGLLYNYDYELGHDGFIGIKTGSDGPAGGCFLFDDAVKAGAGTVHIVGAVLGSQTAPIIQSALNDAVNLVNALRPHVGAQQLVTAGQQVAEVTTPWGAAAPVDTAKSVSAEGWPGLHVPGTVSIRPLASTLQRGQQVGTLTVTVGGTAHQVPLVMGAAIAGPTTSWKLTRL